MASIALSAIHLMSSLVGSCVAGPVRRIFGGKESCVCVYVCLPTFLRTLLTVK